jgi:predicted nucleic acid-binding protein
VVSLLDVNVLVALFVPEHQHHVLALDWFATECATDGWATCAGAESG